MINHNFMTLENIKTLVSETIVNRTRNQMRMAKCGRAYAGASITRTLVNQMWRSVAITVCRMPLTFGRAYNTYTFRLLNFTNRMLAYVTRVCSDDRNVYNVAREGSKSCV